MRDYAIARSRMVSEQLEAAGVTVPQVLRVMRQVPRHRFVAKGLQHRAYHGCALPIGNNQTISQPFIVGLMTALLELTGREHVLEVGTGSGYQAAILSALAATVVSVERIEPLAIRAAHLIEELGLTNVEVYAADGNTGIAERAPYDAIIVTACAPRLPIELFNHLKEGGRMVIPIGEGDEQLLYRYHKRDAQAVIERSVACRFVPMLAGVATFSGREEHA